MLEKVYYFISLLCAVQGILLAIIFFVRKPNHVASKFLGAYVFIFSLGMLEKYLDESLTGPFGQLVYSFMGFSNFLYGPLLYMFVSFLTVKEPVFKTRQLLHFLPFGFLFVLDCIFILTAQQSIRKDIGLLEIVLFETLVLQILTYNVLAILNLKKHSQSILQIHSNLETKDLTWLQSLIIFLTGIYVLSFTITHAIAFGFKGAEPFYLLVQVLITAVIYLMNYRMLLQPQLFILQPFSCHDEITTEPTNYTANTTEKYLRSGLKPPQAEKYLQDLLDYMENQKPYSDPDLTLPALADKLGISRNHLTEIINEKLEKNFFEFVNTYRVEEVKKLLADSGLSYLNLYALGLKAGFKSKTAFNQNFKKITGLTPSKWKQEYHRNTPLKQIILKEVLT